MGKGENFFLFFQRFTQLSLERITKIDFGKISF